jgi:hypothetical protein
VRVDPNQQYLRALHLNLEVQARPRDLAGKGAGGGDDRTTLFGRSRGQEVGLLEVERHHGQVLDTHEHLPTGA